MTMRWWAVEVETLVSNPPMKHARSWINLFHQKGGYYYGLLVQVLK